MHIKIKWKYEYEHEYEYFQYDLFFFFCFLSLIFNSFLIQKFMWLTGYASEILFSLRLAFLNWLKIIKKKIKKKLFQLNVKFKLIFINACQQVN